MRATTIALVGLALLVIAWGGGGSGGGGAGETATPAAERPPTPRAGATATDAPAGGGVQLDLCSMIGTADVEAVLGEPAEAGVDDSYADLFACSWKGVSNPTKVMTVSIYVHPDAATAREGYLATTEGLGGVDIPNLADEASYSESFGLQVLSGRYDLAVDNTGPQRKASALTIAQQVLAELP